MQNLRIRDMTLDQVNVALERATLFGHDDLSVYRKHLEARKRHLERRQRWADRFLRVKMFFARWTAPFAGI